MQFSFNNYQFEKNQKGQSLFEVVIAIFIISMIIVGVVSVSTSSLSNSIFSRNKTLAGRYSQEAIEWLRSQRDKDISGFVAKTSSNTDYCLQNLEWTNTGLCGAAELISNTLFKRQMEFSTSVLSNKNIIEATVVTSWNDSRGYHESRYSTNFNDIREK